MERRLDTRMVVVRRAMILAAMAVVLVIVATMISNSSVTEAHPSKTVCRMDCYFYTIGYPTVIPVQCCTEKCTLIPPYHQHGGSDMEGDQGPQGPTGGGPTEDPPEGGPPGE